MLDMNRRHARSRSIINNGRWFVHWCQRVIAEETTLVRAVRRPVNGTPSKAYRDSVRRSKLRRIHSRVASWPNLEKRPTGISLDLSVARLPVAKCSRQLLVSSFTRRHQLLPTRSPWSLAGNFYWLLPLLRKLLLCLSFHKLSLPLLPLRLLLP